MSALRPISTLQFGVANTEIGVIQAPHRCARIMRYELTDFEWTAIRLVKLAAIRFGYALMSPRPILIPFGAAKLPGSGRNRQDRQQGIVRRVADLGNTDQSEKRAGGQADVGPGRKGSERCN